MSEGDDKGRRKQLSSKMQIFKGFRMQLFTMVVLWYDKVKVGYERSELPGLTLLGVHNFFQGFLEAVHKLGQDHNKGVWFLESMVKMVQWDFSLIKNRVPRVQFPCLQIDTVQPENKSSHLSQSGLVS